MSRKRRKGPASPEAQVPPRMWFMPGPGADETCFRSSVVERGGVRWEVWTCSAPVLRPRGSAYLFPADYAAKYWPGAIHVWYDATYLDDGSCFPGRTQFAVYAGGRGPVEPAP